MAAPNLLNPTTATGTVAGLALTTSAQTLINNAASSGTVVRVNAINIANINGTATADVTVNLVRSVSNTGTYRLAFTVAVPNDASLIVVGKITSSICKKAIPLRHWQVPIRTLRQSPVTM